MGAMLSAPISSKNIERCGSGGVRAASCEMQGFRQEQEDGHTCLLDLPGHPGHSMVGVYDGHSGVLASRYLTGHLWRRVAALQDPTNEKQLIEAVMAADAEFIAGETPTGRDNGSACIFAVLKRNEDDQHGRSWGVTVANCGDSRVLVVRSNGEMIPLSYDHKPDTPEEGARIVAAGGHVAQNRVDGGLAMSRAIGDYQYKSNADIDVTAQKVIPVPDIMRGTVRAGDLLLVCCDGIVEAMENEQVAAIIREVWPTAEHDPAVVLRTVFEQSLQAGSKDNHTAVLLSFGTDDTYSEGYAREPEFLAGPFTPYSEDQNFVTAYQDDAAKYGCEGQDLVDNFTRTETNNLMTVFPSDQSNDIMRLAGPIFSSPHLSPQQKVNALSQLTGANISLQPPGASDDEAEPPQPQITGAGDAPAPVTPVVVESRRQCAMCGAQPDGQKLKACKDCHAVYYCGRDCQKQDWKRHKPECQQQR